MTDILNNRVALTPAEAAKLIGISMPKMYELCRRSDFPAIRIGKSIRIPKSRFEAWLEGEERGSDEIGK